MKKIKILVSSLFVLLSSCANFPDQKLGTILPELVENEFSLLKHTISCNSLAPLAIIDHHYNDDLAAIDKFIGELEKTSTKRYNEIPDNKNVLCPQINTYSFFNDELNFTFDVINMFVVKNDVYYELEQLSSFVATRTTHGFSKSTMILKILDASGEQLVDSSLTLPSLEFEEIAEFNGNDVKFTIETGGGIISIYDAVTFGLNVSEKVEQFYKVISDDTFSNLF